MTKLQRRDTEPFVVAAPFLHVQLKVQVVASLPLWHLGLG